jgi:hypothetical protein
MKEPAIPSSRTEPRWPAVLVIVTVLVLLAVLPGRIRLFPASFPYVLGIAVLIPMAAVALTSGNARMRRIERATLRSFFAVALAANLGLLAYLVDVMLGRSVVVGGKQLLASSVAVWIINVLVFSLLYWELDRGGPDARVNNIGTKPDWLFPQDGAPEAVPPGWQPAFVDYLFLGFSTATAFSTTDAVPLTVRSKLLMMLESTTSLVTLVVVAARAINIIGN